MRLKHNLWSLILESASHEDFVSPLEAYDECLLDKLPAAEKRVILDINFSSTC